LQVRPSELSSIDYGTMIGGEPIRRGREPRTSCSPHSLNCLVVCLSAPLSAVVRAQAAAALTTVQYIKAVGFDENNRSVQVAFRYNITNSSTGLPREHIIAVPILTIVPIPFLMVRHSIQSSSPAHSFVLLRPQVDECVIEFNAKISSVTKSETALASQYSRSTTTSLNFLFYSSSMTSSYSSQQSQKRKSKETREYSMKVRVKAVQDEMPAGTAKMLNVLETVIRIERGIKP
jgi:hypothetical protein